MTPQEQTMLGDLIRRIQTTNLTEKDQDAQTLLQRELGSNPDSLYVLAQTVLVQNYALEQARQQMEQLKQQAQSAAANAAPPAKASSFLGSIFGHRDEAPPAAVRPQAYTPRPPQTAASQWSTPQGAQPAYPPQYAPQAYPAQAYPPPAAGGGSSFLRSAATTAAGVAAGALAFEGVESLMHGFGHQAGFGGGGGFGGIGTPVQEENVVNNYYDSPGSEGGHEERGGYESTGNDASDRDMPALDNAGYTGPADDNLQPELDQADDVNVTDDSGSYDDASDDAGDDSGADFSGGDDSNFV